MAIRVTKSSGDVYADLGIKKRRNPHHGSTLDSFLKQERIPVEKRHQARKKSRAGRRKKSS
jgi:hypothetical protein